MESPIKASHSVSIIVPTFNGASRITHCLDALLGQTRPAEILAPQTLASANLAAQTTAPQTTAPEIIVVDDGSTDNTAAVVAGYPGVRLITQANAGPAAARNRGALEAAGSILLFTDDDCVPVPDWLEQMLRPFDDPEVVGSKGVYRTRQRSLAARFVQIEYEDRYRLMAALRDIDFIDTYSAAYLRDRFLEMRGYDTSFPVACAEDIELSYRMSARGWKMRFAPAAIVYHTHPATFRSYFRKKYKFAYWRVLAVRKNPGKGVKDSHTPQVMKLQLLFAPALAAGLITDLVFHLPVPASLVVLAGFLLSTLPFAVRAFRKDPLLGLLSPLILAGRACAQFWGVATGLISARREPARVYDELPRLR